MLVQHIFILAFVERDSFRVNSSRWYDIQTKARSKQLKERERGLNGRQLQHKEKKSEK